MMSGGSFSGAPLAAESLQLTRSSFKSPEGGYVCAATRRTNLAFQPDLATRLTLAELTGDLAGQFLVCNIGNRLFVYPATAVDKDAAAVVHFAQPGTGATPCYPTCHSHAQTQDDYDLLVGLNTGEVVLMSLRAQLRMGGSLARPATSVSFNFDASVNGSRCVSAAWLPGSQGQSFITAHRDGGVYLHHKVVGSSSDSKLLARTNSQQALRPPFTQLQGVGGGSGANAAAPSPDGTTVAVACKDGVLRLYDVASAALLGGFKSYYGGLLCVCWSPDSKYVATGGEDDLVAVYGRHERAVVAFGQGHSSWVSTLAFDPWQCHPIEQPAAAAMSPRGLLPAQGEGAGPAAEAAAGGRDVLYRLASGGQDCCLLLWDVVVSEDSLAAGAGAGGSGGHITPSMPRAEMPFIPSIAQQKAHAEPLSDVLFLQGAMVTACHGGNVKVWRRPKASTGPALKSALKKSVAVAPEDP